MLNVTIVVSITNFCADRQLKTVDGKSFWDDNGWKISMHDNKKLLEKYTIEQKKNILDIHWPVVDFNRILEWSTIRGSMNCKFEKVNIVADIVYFTANVKVFGIKELNITATEIRFFKADLILCTLLQLG